MTFEELERVIALASGDTDRDLSPNDLQALRACLRTLREVDGLLRCYRWFGSDIQFRAEEIGLVDRARGLEVAADKAQLDYATRKLIEECREVPREEAAP